MKKYKLKGPQLRLKHINELYKSDDLIALVKFHLWGFDKTKWKPLGDIYNEKERT
jgi:hypothetical protein